MDPSAQREFLDFVESSTPALMRSAYALTGQQHAAEDLVQTAFERVAPRWAGLTEPVGYARRVMYHEHISWWRRWRRSEFSHPTPIDRPTGGDAAGGDLADGVALRGDLRVALDQLGPRQRAVLILRYLEDRTVEETADILGCSTGTVRSQASRALARLREFTDAPALSAEGSGR